MKNISKKSNKIKFRLPLNESIKIKDDGTPDWDAMDPETKAKFMADLRDYFRNERDELNMAADDGEDLYDLQNDNYENPHQYEDWDLNDSNDEFLDDFREIPDTYDPEEIHYESLNHRAPITFKEYTHWNEFGDGYSKRYGALDDEDEDDLYEEDDFSDTDEFIDGLDFYDDSPLDNEDFYDDDEDDIEAPEIEEIDGSEIDDSSVIYPEDYDDEDNDIHLATDDRQAGQWYEKKESTKHPFRSTAFQEARNPKYTSAEVLMYFNTREDRDKAFSILLDHEEDVYKCDAHYTPAFPGSEKKQAIDRALVIYCELFGSYDIVEKDSFDKDKAGEKVVVPVKHTKYVGMDDEVKEFVEDMESLLPVKVVDYEYRGVLDESKKMVNRLREGGDIAYIFDEEGFKRSGIYDELTMSYGKKIADIFLDWVKSPEYKNGRFVITYEWGPDSAMIEPADLMDIEMHCYYAELFAEYNGIHGIKFGGFPGSFMSVSYMDRALVRIESTKDDVRFIGKSGPMNHLNGDVDLFDDEI